MFAVSDQVVVLAQIALLWVAKTELVCSAGLKVLVKLITIAQLLLNATINTNVF
jgi:hypothetical protein